MIYVAYILFGGGCFNLLVNFLVAGITKKELKISAIVEPFAFFLGAAVAKYLSA